LPHAPVGIEHDSVTYGGPEGLEMRGPHERTRLRKLGAALVIQRALSKAHRPELLNSDWRWTLVNGVDVLAPAFFRTDVGHSSILRRVSSSESPIKGKPPVLGHSSMTSTSAASACV